MNTKVLLVDNNVDNLLDCPQVKIGAEFLRENQVVAFPTETVYGLGGNAYSDEAITKIYAAKGRPIDNPLIVHIGHIDQLTEMVTHISETAKQLIDQFWPGPLTLIFKNSSTKLSKNVTAGLPTIAVRMPDHPIARALIQKADLPIAAPSANQSGKPSPTTADHVFADLNGKIAAIIDGGQTGVGVESTVVDCTVHPPLILRPGGISKEQLEDVVGEVQVDRALIDVKEVPKSPGMKYRHYAPDVPLFLVDGSSHFLQQLVDDHRKKGKKVGILTTEENKSQYEADVVFICGERMKLETVATHLFETLRSLNEHDLDIVFAETFAEEGIGSAIMNRLLKASGDQIIREQ